MTMATETTQPQQENKALVTKEVRAFGVETIERSAELSAIAVASSAKAEVEAAYVMAMKNPRNEDEARVKILASCRRPLFAAKAKYRKPQGGEYINGQWVAKHVVGPSIRFAEEMLRCWKNVGTQQTAVYDDATKRIVRITTRDLESNTFYSKEITLEKAVERKSSKDREVLGQRMNTNNAIVYIVKATEDELNNKESALASKVIRNNGLRLIPQHIIDEAMAEIDRMIKEKITQDPDGERKAILDGFAKRGVMPQEIERFLSKPSAQFSADDMLRLREMLTSIEDGHSSWQEFLDGTPSQTTNDIAEKSQVETKGAQVNQKLQAVVMERGVESVAPSEQAIAQPQSAQEPSKPEEQGNLQAPAKTSPTEAAASQDPPVDSPEWIAANTQTIQAIQAAEATLKETEAGKTKYQAVLSVMKVRLQKGQHPMDVLPREQRKFYLSQLQRAIAAMAKA